MKVLGKNIRYALGSAARLIRLSSIVLVAALLLVPGEAVAIDPITLFRRALRKHTIPHNLPVVVPDRPRMYSTGVRSWEIKDNRAWYKHVFNAEFTNNGKWPKPDKNGVQPPYFSGGGHGFDLCQESLPGYLTRIAVSRKGQYQNEFHTDLGLMLRRHYGVNDDLDLFEPQGDTLRTSKTGIVTPAQIETFFLNATRNVGQHENGVIILDIPEELWRQGLYRDNLKAHPQIQSDPFTTGMLPTQKTLFPMGTSPQQVEEWLWKIQSDSWSIESGNIITGRTTCVPSGITVRAAGYPKAGMQSMYPVFNQQYMPHDWKPYVLGP